MPGMSIKGITLKSRVDFVEHFFGKGALSKLLPHVGTETRNILSDPKKIRATAWYDLGIQIELDTAICEQLMGGDKDAFRKLGAHSAEFQRSNATVSEYRDPWRFLQLQQVVFGRYFSPGKMELERVSDTEGYVRLHEFRSCRANCDTNLGFLTRSIELCGMKDVVVEETQCSEDPKVPCCEYHLKWEKG